MECTHSIPWTQQTNKQKIDSWTTFLGEALFNIRLPPMNLPEELLQMVIFTLFMFANSDKISYSNHQNENITTRARKAPFASKGYDAFIGCIVGCQCINRKDNISSARCSYTLSISSGIFKFYWQLIINAYFQHANIWVLVVGAILAFVLGFGMGANDGSFAWFIHKS